MNAPPYPGLFITFEGGEGGGKSTQFARLAARLRGTLGPAAVVTLREPGGTGIGEEIRALLKSAERSHAIAPATELLLFAASRAQLVREIIRPALDAGKIVLCDRFFDSTTVYQGVARRLDPVVVETINAFAAAGCVPDATVLLDLPVPTARERLHGRLAVAPMLLADRLDAEPDAFFEAVRAGYQRLAETQPGRFIVVDADRPADEIEADLWTRLQARCPHGLLR